MEKYTQKKLIISDENQTPDFLKKDEFDPNFIMNELKKKDDKTFASQCMSDDLLTEKDNFFKSIFFNEVKNNELKILLKIVYKKLTSGGYLIINTNQVSLHKIELAGMMMYYGFETLSDNCLNNKKYTIAQKKYEKSKIEKPALSFLIKLDRVGRDGKNIKIHKFRSMYRYSEFLHQGMLESSGLSSIGKVKSDPRITPLGRFMRKYWIDELPQILDLMTFKIKLIGIRAMSYTFFEQYPKRYKQKYFKVKPGLIGPIFDEKTTGFNEIVKIEEQYLDNYLESPYKTDFKLFFKTIFMIFKGARSN
tara:strand:- start:4942 stop:5859 length:918 start_codon:yes stop_codon:yes gene_type:complete